MLSLPTISIKSKTQAKAESASLYTSNKDYDTTLRIYNMRYKSLKSVSFQKEQAILFVINRLELPLANLNKRQTNLVADVLLEKYNASMENQIMENLMKTEENVEFSRSLIAEKISLLQKFIRSNFANPERYTGENKLAFDEFKSLNPERQKTVIENLSSKLK